MWFHVLLKRADLDNKFKCPMDSLNRPFLYVGILVLPATNGTNKEGSNGIQTDDEGEYKSGGNCLKIRASLKEDVSPEGQAMRNNQPGTSNLLSLSGICRRESRSIRLN
jgi:hypothetical protein